MIVDITYRVDFGEINTEGFEGMTFEQVKEKVKEDSSILGEGMTYRDAILIEE